MDEMYVRSASKFQKPKHHKRRWTEEEQQALLNEFRKKKTLHKNVSQLKRNCKN